MADKVIIAIPAYNAEGTIERVFERIPDPVDAQVEKYVVVNDGSTDQTSARLAALQQTRTKMVVLQHEVNRGYGAAEKTLLRHALAQGASFVVLVHADGQYAPEKIPDLLAPLRDGSAALVQGSRMLGGGARRGGMPLYKYVANRMLTGLENLAFGLRMAEYHSGYMAYSRSFLESVPFERFSDSFDFDLEMIVAARIRGCCLKEVPIPTRYADEVSHLKPIQYGFDVLGIVCKYLGGHYHRMLADPETNQGRK